MSAVGKGGGKPSPGRTADNWIIDSKAIPCHRNFYLSCEQKKPDLHKNPPVHAAGRAYSRRPGFLSALLRRAPKSGAAGVPIAPA